VFYVLGIMSVDPSKTNESKEQDIIVPVAKSQTTTPYPTILTKRADPSMSVVQATQCHN
jgi:hypothetical protein